MITYYRAVRKVAHRIADAATETVTAFHERRVEQEPAITDRMLGGIEESLRDFRTHGIRWTAKTLTATVRKSQESRYGADFMGVLNIALPGFSISKGFLAQAKVVRNGFVQGRRRLTKQCEKMLNLSPDSFVFLYSELGIRVVPAVSVVGSALQPTELYSRSIQRFFEEHLESFIGDRAIRAATPDILEALRRRFEARNALLVSGESVSDRQLTLEGLSA